MTDAFEQLAPADWRKLATADLSTRCTSRRCSRSCTNDVITSNDHTFLERLRLAGIAGAASPSTEGEYVAHVTAYGRGVIDVLRLIGTLAAATKPDPVDQHPEPIERKVTLMLELLDSSLAEVAGMPSGLLRKQASRRLADARKSLRDLAKLVERERLANR